MKFLSKKGLYEILLKVLGSVFFFLGVLGVILPFLPTTPFILLALGCYVRSSDRLHQWVQNQGIYKKTVGAMIERKGMTVAAKLTILIPVWVLLIVMFFATENLWIKGLALLLGGTKTFVFWRIRTIRKGSVHFPSPNLPRRMQKKGDGSQ
jgi:hypothetical protein